MENSLITSDSIRKTFIEYFKSNSHKVVDSSTIIPNDDDSVLFTNAGMIQFKKWFTGELKPKFKNVVSIQKCIRAGGKHNDLENVGYTPRHHTFFEMLGNFSFGGYFKEEAIFHAWNLLTKEYSLNKNKLLITVYKNDKDSEKIWKKITGFSDSKIIKIDNDDNFWSMGDTGPCGPCTEIFYDNGIKISGGIPGSKDQDGDRYIEIWNLVFMEFLKTKDGLNHLPGKYVDTGMGLERLTAVINGKLNNYETDLYLDLLDEIKKLSGVKADKKNISSFRIISDHIKSISFLMSEGILPTNEGRGYVLRRIIRRALLHCHKLNKNVLILSNLIDNIIHKYSSYYYELNEARTFVSKNLSVEEEKFSETLQTGLQLLNNELLELKGSIFPASIAFKLYDTYGFPVDMTSSILQEKNIKLNLEEYDKIIELNKKKQKAFQANNKNKHDIIIYNKLSDKLKSTKFCGYQENQCEAKLIEIINNDKVVNDVKRESENVELIFDKTPFYAESGGQVGDSGSIYNLQENLVALVSDTQVIENNIYIHTLNNITEEIKVNEIYKLVVDKGRRNKIRNNHSATHLLHESLRIVVGPHVTQKGSLVNEEKLRFDYTSTEQLTNDQIHKIESLVNTSIRSNISSNIKLMPVKQAVQSGAIALFGEKYPDNVRVISLIDKNKKNISSVELCGGTHVDTTGQIGFLKMLNESSVSSGIRRVEAITGEVAEKYVTEKIIMLDNIKLFLKANDTNIIDKLENIKKELSEYKKGAQKNNDFFSENNILKIKEVKVYYQKIDCDPKDLRNKSDQIKSKFQSGVIILFTVSNKKISVVTSVSKDLLKTFDANIILRKLIDYLGGKGSGGRNDLAQGGAPYNNKVNDLKDNISKFII